MLGDRVSTYHVGFDDTDSSEGMCTTFLAYNVVQRLRKNFKREEIVFIDYPNLIRLNPNIPWKTRGNASLVLRFASCVDSRRIIDLFKRAIDEFATSERANAGLVVLPAEDIPREIKYFSDRALYSVLGLREARDLISRYGLVSYSLRSGQGLVGALAGIGNTLEADHTFELIAYRKDCSKKRLLDRQKVIQMSKESGETFSSYDPDSGRILIAPHGPDPVFFGIRGETPSAVKHAFEIIQPKDNLLGWMIFRTNQGTGEHLNNNLDLSKIKAYTSGKVRGTVSFAPEIERGGHVFFELRNEQGAIRCACYEPTGNLRKQVLKLICGDYIEVGGGVRKATSKHPQVLNLEYFQPLQLARRVKLENPICPECGTTMKSKGVGQDLLCPKCKRRARPSKIVKIEQRALEYTAYLPRLNAHRHLTKPLSRREANLHQLWKLDEEELTQVEENWLGAVSA